MSAKGSVSATSRREADALEIREQENEDAAQRGVGEPQEPLAGIVALFVFAEQFGMMGGRKLHRCQPCLEVTRNGAEVAARDVARHVNATRGAFAFDFIRRRHDGDVGDFAEANGASEPGTPVAPGVSMSSSRNAVRSCPRLGHAPHRDAVDFLLLENLANLLPFHERRDGAEDLRLGESVDCGGVLPRRDDDLRHERLLLDLQCGHAGHVLENARDLRRLRAQRREVGTEDAHDDARARAGEHFLDALAQIRQQVALQAGVAVHDVLHFLHGRFVIGFRIEGDPQLGEVWPDHFIGDFGATDVRAQIAHAGDRTQFLARRDGDARHRIERSRGLLDPVHEKIAFLEIRKQFLTRGADTQTMSRQMPRQANRQTPRGHRSSGGSRAR